MKILFACGGTAGHINPAIAVANYMKEKDPETKVLFAGNPNGMESRIVPNAGYDFAPIKVLGIQRRINMRNIKNNIKAIWYLMNSSSRAKEIIEGFKPDIVIGTGGYVSGPVVRKAALLGYKTIAMESNAFPGMTTKLLAKHVDKILLDVEESKKFLPEGKEYIVTGNPVRQEIFTADRKAAREFYNIGERICILSFGGSLGAQRLNEAVSDLMAWHLAEKDFVHIHGSGSYYGPSYYYDMLKEKGIDAHEHDNLIIREYINDMPRCLAAADLVISRCGAITLAELKAAGRASVLIPSPNVAENHQYHNAMVLQSHGAGVVIEEKDLTGELLCKTVKELTENPEKLKQLSENAKALAVTDANERIRKEIISLYER
ncbi:MAG: undecaprenyldiphospho-muramoylpentapeptide beta-N-acetylglucosaminyltransferase [Oscillospiraceae bacterium]|nr:undecaprenyldiphospho-muramoylpentapeptide beta-N-acetylglucosaminyltransferase [Oscillospiraceae bacterium]MBQ3237058.1 undecaprenyldiphospho-muramoylpentapeptide beta-N-acetylglucosaminyltransferase [Oscillospiraceae bacterium]